jgi:hypothetical protein
MAGNTKSQSKVVAELLDLIEMKLRKEETKSSLGDYIRLVQLQKDIEGEDPREIKVGWVDKLETQEEETDKLETQEEETQTEETDKLETQMEETETMKTNEPDKDSGPSNS